MKRAATRPKPSRAPTPVPPGVAIVAAVATTLTTFALLIRLGGIAGRARLYTDECFHAHVAEWIASHHRLPDVMPELYSGFYYYYPPLLHLLGAVWVALAGVAGIVLLNVLLFGALLAALAALPVPGLAAAPRRWAILLCAGNGWLATYATRFYAEMLISALVLAAVLLLWRALRTGRMRDAVALGVASGLALTAKHTALVLPATLAVLAIVAAARRDAGAARRHLVSLALAAVIALPYFVRNWVLWGSPIYPALGRDTHALVWKLNLAKFSPPPLEFYRGSLEAIGPWVLAMAAAAVAVALARRRMTLPLALIVGGCAVLALGVVAPLHDVRHATPLIAVLAVAASAVVWEAVSRRVWLAWAIELVLLVSAVVSVATLGDLREDIDLPPGLAQAYDAAQRVAPAGATILSLWTYDTYYYTRLPATWPIPWAQREHPVELFYEQDPARFESLMRRYHIELMFVPRTRPPAEFDGANYPASFVRCVVTLLERGRLVVLWQTDRLALVALAPATR